MFEFSSVIEALKEIKEMLRYDVFRQEFEHFDSLYSMTLV